MDCYFAAVKKRLQSFELSAALPLPTTIRADIMPPGFPCLLLPHSRTFAVQILRPTCRYYRGLSPLPSAVIPQTIKNRLTRYSVLKSSQTKSPPTLPFSSFITAFANTTPSFFSTSYHSCSLLLTYWLMLLFFPYSAYFHHLLPVLL